jgi:hypothetical protein
MTSEQQFHIPQECSAAWRRLDVADFVLEYIVIKNGYIIDVSGFCLSRNVFEYMLLNIEMYFVQIMPFKSHSDSFTVNVYPTH